MFQTSIIQKQDLDEACKAERRRQFEEERQKRIFNAHQRLFGLDLNALNRQQEEKKKLQEKRTDCQKKWEEELKRQQLTVQEHLREEDQKKRMLVADLNTYRCRFQRFDQRREFDLNDPELLKKMKPARVADVQLDLGISSAQIFDGEDVGSAQRRQRQRDQQRCWLEQQMAERRRAEQAREKANSLMLGNMLDCEARLNFLAESESRVRSEKVEAVRQYNAARAEEKRFEREREKKERWEDDLAEIYNMLSSDMLTENPDVATSHSNPNKKVAYLYRGMSPAELQKFYDEQKQQMVEMKRRRRDEQMRGKLWEQLSINMERELRLKDLALDRERAAEFAKILKANDEIAKQQRQRRETEEGNRRNVISDEFFEQFNKNSR